jgi:hypothetical protein
MELTSDINIVPGLSGINLNILHAIDMHMIDNAKHTISKWIQKEHRIVANVQKTMVALLKTKIPRETREARIELVKSSTQTFTSFTITFVILNCQYFVYI